MFCHNCGKQILDSSTFCGFCGARQNMSNGGISSPINYKPAEKPINFVVIIAAVIMSVGTLLPCASVGGLDVACIKGDEGIIILFAAAAVCVLAAARQEKFAAVPAVIAIIVLIGLFVDMSKANHSKFGDTIEPDIGMYLMWIGAIGSVTLPYAKMN